VDASRMAPPPRQGQPRILVALALGISAGVFAGGMTLAGVAWNSHTAPAYAEEEGEPDSDDGGDTGQDSTDLLVVDSLPFDPPSVLEPGPGEVARIVQDGVGDWYWLLTITNGEFDPAFVADEGVVVFESLPSVGVYDTVAERLAWTNESFACSVGTDCVEPALTADQNAFGGDFVRLPKLYDEDTGAIAYHVEHAYQVGQDPVEWLFSRETLTLAIPLDPSPRGPTTIWVGYTYVYTDDMVGRQVRFSEEAMAVVTVEVTLPEPPVTPPTEEGVAPTAPLTESTLPSWVGPAGLGFVALIVLGAIVAMVTARVRSVTRDADDEENLAG
jgi:hypothetical protein